MSLEIEIRKYNEDFERDIDKELENFQILFEKTTIGRAILKSEYSLQDSDWDDGGKKLRLVYGKE